MANKYLRHGETYCGDGTTSAAAASNGAAGAWNDKAVLTGTAPAYGALSNGDVVLIRSKDQAGGAISITSAATISIGKSGTTEASPVQWVIDDGTVWSGISGVVTISTTAGSAGITIRDYNHVIASNYNLVLSSTVASYGNAVFFTGANCLTRDIKIDTSANTSGSGSNHKIFNSVHINPWFRQGAMTYSLFIWDRYFDTTIISPKIEILGPLTFAASATKVFDMYDSIGGKTFIYGGELVTSFTGLILTGTENFSSTIDFFGFKYPSTTKAFAEAYTNNRTPRIFNGGDGALGNVYVDYHFTYSSRHDGYYPTLNAQLELSSSAAWSYNIYPYRTTPQQPVKVAISKLWAQAAAAKTVTLELLWPNTMSAPTSSNVWMSVQYTDNSTGNKVTQDTMLFPGSALTSSSASWSSATYGPSLFTKFKLSLTTESSIKQDTEVMVTFFSSPKATSDIDVIILCPDVVLS